MKKFILILSAVLSVVSFGRTVSTGTFVANPGTVVSVPVKIDTLSDVGAATLVINYDATVVSCLGIDPGDAVLPDKLIYADTGAGQVVMVFSGFRQETGVVAKIRLLAREGTRGLYSDVTIAEADLAAKDGLTDLSVGNSVSTVNGMIRVVASSAEITRLENAYTVSPKTTLKTLSMAPGDALMASDDRNAIVVTQSVTAPETVVVEPPLNGWTSGTYALLTTPTAGLKLQLNGAGEAIVREVVSGGLTTYYADVTIEGEVTLAGEDGDIPAETLAQVRTALAEELANHPDVKSVVIKGDAALVPLIVDLGIAPAFDVLGTSATATYTQPSLSIMSFDPKTGLVRIKVTPGAGNAIRTTLATGCIHVYGTSDLSQKMRYLSGTSIDLTPYLKPETKGEADLTVALGTHTFIKVKAETLIKQEGDQE